MLSEVEIIMRYENNEVIRFTIINKVLNDIDDRLFGQFLEKAGFSEPGPEAALIPGTRKLLSEVEEMLKQMKIPIIRFPAGAALEYDMWDWRDMIDNVPGREGGRKVYVDQSSEKVLYNNFGYDEFLRFAESHGIEPLLPVHFRTALGKLKPLEEIVKNAASLVAYCNAPLGAKLPQGMGIWPEVRAKNGHEQPYNVSLFQIANEPWLYAKRVMEEAGITSPEEKAQWYLTCIKAVIDGMRQIDPSIQIIMDGHIDEEFEHLILADEELRQKVQYVTFHTYAPWGFSNVLKDSMPYPAESLSEKDVWYTFVSVPGFDEDGRAIIKGDFRKFMDNSYKKHDNKWDIAITEWNWNGWYEGEGTLALSKSQYVKGVGAAGWLHGFMREGDKIRIATQSCLITSKWVIGAIQIDEKCGKPPYFNPTGLTTMLYSKYHGNRRLEVREFNVPVYKQPYTMGGIQSSEKVMMLDVISTEDDSAIYIHVINRSFDQAFPVKFELSGFQNLKHKAMVHILRGRLQDKPKSGESIHMSWIEDIETGDVHDNQVIITIPERSVSIIEVIKG